MWVMSKSNDSETAPEIDKVIHEPSRLKIVAQLYVIESADYPFLMKQLGFTWGNLSAHLSKLEDAGYVAIEKEFVDKKPRTTVSLTPAGRAAFREYRKTIRTVIGDQ
jgi:DNA-binding MarR family transcriptional regulator